MTLLQNAQELHRQNPESFQIPSPAAIKAIKPGSIIKVCASGERFWCTVKEVNQENFIAIVDNDLINTSEHGLKLGDQILIKPENIYFIY